MRKLLSIALLASFVLISALANIGDSYAYSVEENTAQTEILANDTSETVGSLAYNASVFDEKQSETQKDECPCEKESGATKFVCGVTLAPANHSMVFHPPVLPKARYVIFETTGLKSFVDLLKRPPRTLL